MLADHGGHRVRIVRSDERHDAVAGVEYQRFLLARTARIQAGPVLQRGTAPDPPPSGKTSQWAPGAPREWSYTERAWYPTGSSTSGRAPRRRCTRSSDPCTAHSYFHVKPRELRPPILRQPVTATGEWIGTKTRGTRRGGRRTGACGGDGVGGCADLDGPVAAGGLDEWVTSGRTARECRVLAPGHRTLRGRSARCC